MPKQQTAAIHWIFLRFCELNKKKTESKRTLLIHASGRRTIKYKNRFYAINIVARLLFIRVAVCLTAFKKFKGRSPVLERGVGIQCLSNSAV